VCSGTMCLSVSDDARLCSWNIGLWLLRVGEDGAAVVTQSSRTKQRADITLGISALTSLWAGSATASALQRAGMLEAADIAAVDTANRMFATTRAPHCFTMF
jgi:predicted acetyltransferase